MEDPRERIYLHMTSLKCMTSKMTRDYFKIRMPDKPIECILGNSYGRLKEPHPFRLTDETKVRGKWGYKYGTEVILMCVLIKVMDNYFISLVPPYCTNM